MVYILQREVASGVIDKWNSALLRNETIICFGIFAQYDSFKLHKFTPLLETLNDSDNPYLLIDNSPPFVMDCCELVREELHLEIENTFGSANRYTIIIAVR